MNLKHHPDCLGLAIPKYSDNSIGVKSSFSISTPHIES